MKKYIPAILLALACCLFSCSGSRNIYSVSPFVSPVRMEKGATAIEANYFTHTRQRNVPDSLPGNHDNCFGLNISHMFTERTLIFAYADVKKERDQFSDSIRIPNDPSFNSYDGGFDSSIVFGKRYSLGAGMEFFSKDHGKATTGLAASVGFNRFELNESGLLTRIPYQRFYKLNQLSFSLQQNFLFKITDRFKLAWVNRLTAVKSFKANTNYSSVEKTNASLRDKRTDVFLCFTGFYTYFKPVRNFPLSLNGQFFNDLSFWNRSFAKYEPERVYIKGTGVSIGMRYVF